MKNLKNQKGITLVALVVTIIVLLILAGVSLSLVAGSDGILSRASNAVDANLIATIKEKVELRVAEDVTNYYQAKYVDRSIDTAWTAFQYLTNHGEKTITDGGATYTIKYTAATAGSNADNQIEVRYVKGKTDTTIEGTITNDGSIHWITDTISDKAPAPSTSGT